MNKKLSFLVGMLAGLMLAVGIAAGYTGLTNRLSWQGQREPNAKIKEIYRLLDTYSINPYEPDELLENMYRGLLDGVGDPYTYYFDRDALALFNEQTEGTYAGVGMIVATDSADKIVTVLVVYPKTPGERAGILPGDKIIAVDGLDVTTFKLEEVTAMTKGRPGTKVRLTIYRPDDDYTFDLDIMRENIIIPTVSHEMLDEKIGYIRIEGFERVTLGQFAEALTELDGDSMRGLIIDLRNNPGGLLETVTQIADILLPRGVITYTEDKAGEKKYFYSDNNYLDKPLVILVNESSASASEVLCGAVKDLDAGTLVGAKTFGKGIVQSLYGLSDGSAIKITVAKYYTPDGICIHGEGIIPDVVVEMERELTMRIGKLTLEEDVQLRAAIDVMRDKLR